jgi:predicted alpha/beta superfamily hydrolase
LIRKSMLLASLAVVVAFGAMPAVAAPADQPHEVSISNTRKIDFVSSVNGRRYSISVALPSEPAPAGGYRALYVLDGYGYFNSAVEATRGNGNAPGVVVVGIGYPDDPAYAQEVIAKHAPLPPGADKFPPSMIAIYFGRSYDLTVPASDAVLAANSSPGMPVLTSKDVGGIDDLLKTIEADVKPKVAALVPLDPKQDALFGHSLGGLAVLRALFFEPDAFQTFIVASPSIWWNSRSVLEGEAKFAARVTSGAVAPRVIVTMGAQEQTPPASLPAEMEAMRPQINKMIAAARMVDNAHELRDRLAALKGAPGYEVAPFAEFAEQGHGISVWPALGRGISFAFEDPKQ